MALRTNRCRQVSHCRRSAPYSHTMERVGGVGDLICLTCQPHLFPLVAALQKGNRTPVFSGSHTSNISLLHLESQDGIFIVTASSGGCYFAPLLGRCWFHLKMTNLFLLPADGCHRFSSFSGKGAAQEFSRSELKRKTKQPTKSFRERKAAKMKEAKVEAAVAIWVGDLNEHPVCTSNSGLWPVGFFSLFKKKQGKKLKRGI